MTSPPKNTKGFEFTKADPGHFATTTKSTYVPLTQDASSGGKTTNWRAKSENVERPKYRTTADVHIEKVGEEHYVTSFRSQFDPPAKVPRAPLSSDPANHYTPPRDVATSAEPAHFATTTSTVHQAVSSGSLSQSAAVEASPNPSPNRLTPKSSSKVVLPYQRPGSELSPSPETADGVGHRPLRYIPPTTQADSGHFSTAHKEHYSPVRKEPENRMAYNPKEYASPPLDRDTWRTTTKVEFADKSPESRRLNSPNVSKGRFQQAPVKTSAEPDHFTTSQRTHYGKPTLSPQNGHE
jgi:hypothetical protein